MEVVFGGTMRLMKVDGTIYAERVPSHWVEVTEWEDFKECTTDEKVYLIQNALAKNDDFEYHPKPEEIVG